LFGSGNFGDVNIFSSANVLLQPDNGATVGNLFIFGGGPSISTYGILVYQKANVTVWSVNLQRTLIGIGAVGSNDIQLLNNSLSNNGQPGDGIAQPSIYISDSQRLSINYGEIFGGFEDGYGDGEIATYNSTSVSINNLYLNRSGAAGVYMVNCK
jgi:hypothetical protein